MADKDYKALAEQYNTKDYNALAAQYNQTDNSPNQAPISKLESALRGAGQGATGGFSDELVAGAQHPIEGAMKVAQLLGANISPEDVSDYTKSRDESRTANEAAKKENPLSYLGGQLGGGIGSAAAITGLTGGLGAPAAAGEAAQTASVLQKLYAASKVGLGMGAINGLGDSTADTAGGLTADTALGAGTGLLTGAAASGAGQLIGAGAEKLAPTVKKGAEILSAKVLGASKANLGSNYDKMRAVGRMALDKIITPGSNTEEMLDNVSNLKTNAFTTRNNVYNPIDKANASTFDINSVLEKVKTDALGTVEASSKNGQQILERLQPILDSIKDKAPKGTSSGLYSGASTNSGIIPINDAQSLVSELGANATWDTTRSNLDNRLAKNAYHSVRNAINDAVESSVNNMTNNPEIGQAAKAAVTSANEQMHLAPTMEKLLNRTRGQELGGKSPLNPTIDELAGALYKPGLAAGKYVGRQVYNAAGGTPTLQRNMAIGMDKAADIMSGKAGVADAILSKTQKFVDASSAKLGPDAFLTKALQKIHANPADMFKKSMMNVLLQSGYKPHLESLHKDIQDQDEQNSSGATNGSETSEN